MMYLIRMKMMMKTAKTLTKMKITMVKKIQLISFQGSKMIVLTTMETLNMDQQKKMMIQTIMMVWKLEKQY